MSKLEDFELLGRKWEQILGLTDWRIYYRYPDCDEEKLQVENNFASIYMNREAMVASCIVNPEETQDIKPMEETVVHELLHLVLRPFVVMAECRFNVAEEDMDYEEHRIINKFVWLLLKGGK